MINLLKRTIAVVLILLMAVSATSCVRSGDEQQLSSTSLTSQPLPTQRENSSHAQTESNTDGQNTETSTVTETQGGVTEKTTASKTEGSETTLTFTTREQQTQPATMSQKGTVSLVIQCRDALSVIKDNGLEGYESVVPADGVILSVKKLEIKEGETTVLSLIQDACDKNAIPYRLKSGYIRSINGLAEKSKDFGPQSGWVYSVNDVYPSVGAGSYRLKDGDVVELRYVTKMVTIG